MKMKLFWSFRGWSIVALAAALVREVPGSSLDQRVQATVTEIVGQNFGPDDCGFWRNVLRLRFNQARLFCSESIRRNVRLIFFL